MFKTLRVAVTLPFVILILFAALPLHGQESFITRWQTRATATLAQQPKWPPPVVSPYPQLIQVIRADFVRQTTPAHVTTWNYGAGRGINLIPLRNTEFDIFYPPYIQHSNNAVDGFGDLGFSAKYRFLSRNEGQGNYVVSAFINTTVPTGDHKNGAPHPTITPTIAAGKGFTNFDVTSCFGATIPTEQANTLGRTIAWNTTAQYRLAKQAWVEIEDNATWFSSGPNDGKKQNFLTPGILAGPFKFHPKDLRRREAFNFGAGMQIATSSFHTNNHNLNFTARYTF
jgi:hypothetical protein